METTLPFAAAILRPDHTLVFVLLDIAIILVVARLVGGLSVRFGQPRVVGEIIAGVLLGPTLLGPELWNWTNSPEFLQCKLALGGDTSRASVTWCLFPPQSRPVLGILGQIALALFMFLVGLELNFSTLKGRFMAVAIISVGVVAIPVAAAFAINPVLYNEKFVAGFGTAAEPSKIAFSLMVGAMLSVTAFPVMARILQEKGLSSSAMGSIGIAAAAVVTVLMFALVSVAAGVAQERSAGDHAIKIGLMIAYLGVMALVVRPLLAPLGRRHEKDGLTPEVLVWCVIVVLISAYAAQRLGLSVIVGGFVAGAILPNRMALLSQVPARLGDVTISILLPIFLAFSGLQTDFTKLKPEFWGGVLVFLAAGVVAKWGAGAVCARLAGLSWSEGNVLGILMNCRGLLILVVALIALNESKVITPEMQVGAVLMALVTTIMTGPLIDWALRSIPSAAEAPAEGT